MCDHQKLLGQCMGKNYKYIKVRDNMPNSKVQMSFYINEEIRKLVKFLAKREEITKIVFYRRALRLFIKGIIRSIQNFNYRKKSSGLYMREGYWKPYRLIRNRNKQ